MRVSVYFDGCVQDLVCVSMCVYVRAALVLSKHVLEIKMSLHCDNRRTQFQR